VGALRSASRLAPRNTAYMRRLGEVLAQSGDRQGAAAVYQQLLRINPRDAGARQALDRINHASARPGRR
jgi:cytochrome c-type biogenesis protein CcmH/NrfG